MKLIFSDGTLHFDQHKERIELYKLMQVDNVEVEEIKIDCSTLEIGKLLERLMEITKPIKAHKFLKTLDMYRINQILELCNYLVIDSKDEVIYYISGYILGLFQNVLYAEVKIRSNWCDDPPIENALRKIRKIFGVKLTSIIPISGIKDLLKCGVMVLPYHLNFDKSSHEVRWKKDTIDLLLLGFSSLFDDDDIFEHYSAFFAIMVQLIPPESYSDHEIKIYTDYFYHVKYATNFKFINEHVRLKLSNTLNIKLLITYSNNTRKCILSGHTMVIVKRCLETKNITKAREVVENIKYFPDLKSCLDKECFTCQYKFHGGPQLGTRCKNVVEKNGLCHDHHKVLEIFQKGIEASEKK